MGPGTDRENAATPKLMSRRCLLGTPAPARGGGRLRATNRKDSAMNDIITVTGNIATAPELRQVPGGVAVATFRVASTERRYDRTAGAWVDGHTNWYNVSTFRSLAEHAHRSLGKGHRVILTGRLRVRSWENGERKGTAVDIDADAIGHDLRWGTTQFAPDRQNTAASESDGWSEGSAPDEVDRDRVSAGSAPNAWTVPGAEAESGGGERELVAADAGTPF
jgi:single-strand DNA-binding protein